jgi:hypothetical protein
MKPQARHFQAGLTLNKQFSVFQREMLSTHKKSNANTSWDFLLNLWSS